VNKLNTLHAHLAEMLYAVDTQMEIPKTRMNGGVWLTHSGTYCTMCAAGAWYAHKYGRCNLIDLDMLDDQVRDAMLIMDRLRVRDVRMAYERLYFRPTTLVVPHDPSIGDDLVMDAEWRESMDRLLLWLKANNI